MKEIVYIDASSFGKMLGILVFGVTALFILPIQFLTIGSMMTQRQFSWGVVFIWLFLLIYPGFAYILGLILAYLYNFFAKRIGGIEVEFKE